METYIVVTNYEEVEDDSFYLTDEWGKTQYGRLDEVKEGRQLQKEGKLYIAYIVSAKDFALYWQMDAQEIYINADGNIIIECESQVIDTDFSDKWEYEY